MDLIPGYQGYLDQYRPPGYDGNHTTTSGPPPLVYPEEVGPGDRRRAVSGDRMVILPRRPSEEPDYVIPSSAMQQMLQERDRSRRQQEWVPPPSQPPPRVPHLGYPSCHEQYPGDQGRLAQDPEKLSSQEKEKRKIHAASEYYRKMREETAMRQSDFVMSPLGSQHSPGGMSLGSPGIPSPQNSTPQSSPLMQGGLVSPTGGPSGPRQGRGRKNSEPPQHMAGDPNCAGPNGNVNPNANIDLGALYQQTVENRVTRTFSQHWIIVGKHLRVLLLDFDAKFTLLIPNIELGKAFRINKADVEVQTKELEGGHKLTFMKFIFQSPALEIKAPVLNDKTVGYQVLQQNGACVFLSRIFNIPTLPQNQGEPSPSPSQHPRFTNGNTRSQHPAHPMGPGYRGPPQGPLHQPVRYPGPPGQASSHLATAMLQQQGRRPPQPLSMGRSQFPDSHGHPNMPGSLHPLQSPINPSLPPPMPIHSHSSSEQQQNSTTNVNSKTNFSSQLSPLSCGNSSLPPISTFKPQENKNKNESFQVSQTERKPSKQNFFELYAALNNEEYAKMTTCSFCQRKFRFTSVLLDHLQTHTVNVDNIVEMKLKIWVNGRKLKCSETGCKKKYAYTLEYTKHKDSHHYEGLNCGVCGCKQLGPADYASHIKKEHPEHLTHSETQAEDIPPPPSEAKEEQPQQISIPSPTVSEAQSPMINQPMQAPTTPSSDIQVHTPQSAPPMMMASPQTLSQPMSPLSQQPRSAPPNTEFSDDFTSAINMPIIDEDALNPPVPDVINKDNEDLMLMNILKDLKDCTQNPYNPPEPSPGAPQSNAQIMADFDMQQENQKFSFHRDESADEQQNFQSPETHPIILSQRSFSTEVNSPAVNSPVQYENPGRSPQITDQIPGTNEDKNTQGQSQSYHEMNPPSYNIEETNSPTQSRSPGVIRRVMDVTDPTNQCYMNNISSPVTQNNSPGNQNMLSNASPHQNMMAYASPATQPSPLATHSYPHDGSPMMNQINLQQNQQISRIRHHSFSYSQSCTENSVNSSSCNEFQNSDMAYTPSSQGYGGTPPQTNKNYQEYPQNQEFSGSGSHSSHAVRALVANKILRRKSRSSSFDSDKSESRMTADNSDPFTSQSPHTLQGAKCIETKPASVITSRHVSESELDKQLYPTSNIPKTSSQESFDFIQTSSEDSSLLPTMINDMNVSAQLSSVQSTPVQSANNLQPVLNPEPVNKDFPTCDNCGQTFRSKAAIANHVRYCLERQTGMRGTGQEQQQASAELSKAVTCQKPELACAQPQVPDLGLPNHAEKLEKNNTENIDESEAVINETVGFNCDNCTDKFMTENSMRIHIAQCGKARLAGSLQSELPENESMSMDCESNEGFAQEDSNDNLDEKDSTSQSKVTPIKSWLRKHMDSVKSPDHVQNKSPPEQKPLYIIPQEPEERTCGAYSSGTSSSEDEDSPKKHKKSPKRRGRPTKMEKVGEKVNYDTKLSTDPVGGIKIKFSKNNNDCDQDNNDDLENEDQKKLSDKEKRPRGRPKGSKNRPKDEKRQMTCSKTPKKSKKFENIPLVPQPPNKIAPTKTTTPSPTNSNPPPSGLSYNLTSLGPSLEEMARPVSRSPRRLSESSGSSSDSESSSESEHSRSGSIISVRGASKSPEIVVVDTIVNKPAQSFQAEFANNFDSKSDEFDEFVPILEVASPKEPTPDIVDNVVEIQESENENIQSLSLEKEVSVENKHKDTTEQSYDHDEYFDECRSRSASPMSTSVDGGNCMSPSQRNNKSPAEDTSLLLTSQSSTSKPELNANSESRADTPNDVPDLPKDETMRSRSSSRSSVESSKGQRSRSNSYQSPVPSRNSSPSANGSPSRQSLQAKSRSQSRSPSASPNRASPRSHRSSSSSSSSSSESESSSADSRSSTPEIPKTPELAPIQQLPIPKLRIKLTNLMQGPKNCAYKPVKVITSPFQPDIEPTRNGFANKLRSLNCKVNVPRLKFKVLDDDVDIKNGVKFHEKDIEELAEHKVTVCTKDNKKLPETDISNPEINRPPIAPIKIRLRTSSETIANTGRSLSSILAEIVQEPCKMPQSTVKDFSEFEIPNSEPINGEEFLFSSSLTKSFSALTKFVETEICRDILNDVVIKVEESRKVSSEIINEVLEDIFFNEACCANILDDVVDMVVTNVEAQKEHIKNERKADIMAQRKFMEQQKLKSQECRNKKDELQAVNSVNKHKLQDNTPKIDIIENEKIVNLPEVTQSNIKSEGDDDIEVIKSTFEVYVSDDESSIELSDSEFDLDGENPSIIEELKFDNPEEPEQCVDSSSNVDTTTPCNDAQSVLEESKFEDACQEKNQEERPGSEDDQIKEANTNQSHNLETKNITQSRKVINKDNGKKPNLSKKLKQKKVPKLLIKPIRKEETPSMNENVAEECSTVVMDMVSKTIKQIEEEEQKMPPIIVKIPKLAISPKKISKRENVKSPLKNSIKNLDFGLSKQPTVSIKNLKILPPVPPEVTEAILELANADEEISEPKKVENKKSITTKSSPTKPLSSTLKLQTPPPLCVIKNKRKGKSPEATSQNMLEQKEKESIVTVLKMSEIVSMKQKEEELDRQNDLKKMLELENKLKVEDMKKIKEDKIQVEQTKKKPQKASLKTKSGKEMKQPQENTETKTSNLKPEIEKEVSSIKEDTNDSTNVLAKPNSSESHKQNDLEKMLENENKMKIEDRKRIKEGKVQIEETKKKQGKGSQKSKKIKTDAIKTDTKIPDIKASKPEPPKEESKCVILAKKSPPKIKVKSNGVRPFTPVAKKAHGTQGSQPEPEKKSEQAAKVGLQRRNSIPKHKEQWVVSGRIKTPSPTPPALPAPFVAKKSRPDETVSFSLPAGGFNSSTGVQSKPKPLLMQVDELFSQYFPGVKEDMKALTETPASKNIDNANEKQQTFKQKNSLVEAILEELLSRVVKTSMKTNLANTKEDHQSQKEAKPIVCKERSRSREVTPDSQITSPGDSVNSSGIEFSLNSNESLVEVHKEEISKSETDLSNRRKKRKSDNLGLNGGYWDAIGVRGVVREKLEKQESIEKEEKSAIRSRKKSIQKESSKKISKNVDEKRVVLVQGKNDSVENRSISQSTSEPKFAKNLEHVISNTTEENIKFVQAIINDIILSLKIIEDSESPPKQTSIKRSPPNESKPSKRLKTTVPEIQDQNTGQYEISDMLPNMEHSKLTTAGQLKPHCLKSEIKNEDELENEMLSITATKENSSETVTEIKPQETMSKMSRCTKNRKKSPELLKIKDSKLQIEKKSGTADEVQVAEDVSERETKHQETKSNTSDMSKATKLRAKSPELLKIKDSLLQTEKESDTVNNIKVTKDVLETETMPQETKSNTSDMSQSTKIGKRSPEYSRIKDIILPNEKKSDNINKVKVTEDVYEIEAKPKETKSNKSDTSKSTKTSKRLPELLKMNESVFKKEKKSDTADKEKVTEDVYEFEDDDPPLENQSKIEIHHDYKTEAIHKSSDNQMHSKEEIIPPLDEHTNKADLTDELVKDNEEEAEIETDIWSSINDTLEDLKESTNKKPITKFNKEKNSSITKEKHPALEDCKDSLLDDLNSSQNSELDGWGFGGDSLKDEITGDNIDIWASTNEIMRSISESLSDVKAVKPESSTTLRDKKESKSSQEITASRKSRQKRKDSEENLGNPDSGKENADVDNLDIAKSDSKKSERVLSPVTKRRKIANRKYINDDFDDSHSPNRQKDTKQNFEKDHQTKRRRSSSSSSEEGVENEAKKTMVEFSEKAPKLVKNPLYKQNMGRKTIQIIDPIPMDPEKEKLKTSKIKSLRESSPQRKSKGDKFKNDNGKMTGTKETKKSSNSSISKPKSIWSSKTSTKSKTKPSTDLVNFLDKEYEKAKKEEISKKISKK